MNVGSGNGVPSVSRAMPISCSVDPTATDSFGGETLTRDGLIGGSGGSCSLVLESAHPNQNTADDSSANDSEGLECRIRSPSEWPDSHVALQAWAHNKMERESRRLRRAPDFAPRESSHAQPA
jgi:hypothetical protein